MVTLSLLALSAAFAAESYDVLQARASTAYPEQTVVVRGKSLSYRAFVRTAALMPEHYVYSAVAVASDVTLEHVGAHFRQYCDKADYLEIYQVSFPELNVPGFIVDLDQKGFGSIWGYFDPRRSRTGLNAISVADHTFETTHIIIAHEVAHYWYERLCLGMNHNATSSEDFARTIEAAFTARFLADRDQILDPQRSVGGARRW